MMRDGRVRMAVGALGLFSSLLCFPLSSYAGEGVSDALQREVDEYNSLTASIEAGRRSIEAERAQFTARLQTAETRRTAVAAREQQLQAAQTRLQELETRLARSGEELRVAGGANTLYRAQRSTWQMLRDNLDPFSSDPQQLQNLERARTGYRAIETERSTLERQMATQQQDLQRLRADCEADLRGATEARGRIDGINQRLAQHGSDANRQLQERMTGFAQRIYDQCRTNSTDARFLMTDFRVLQERHRLQDAQLDALKTNVDAALDNTLMGEYVKSQVRRGMAGVCQQMNDCVRTGADALRDRVAGAGQAPEAGNDQRQAVRLQPVSGGQADSSGGTGSSTGGAGGAGAGARPAGGRCTLPGGGCPPASAR